MEDEKMLNRVRALLTKAEADGVTAEEAESLTAKATELMAKYGIDAAMAAAREDKKLKPGSILVDVLAPYANGKDAVLNAVAQAFGCTGVRTSRHGLPEDGGLRVHVFGFEADLQMVQMLYTSLLLQGAAGSFRVPAGQNARSFRATYWLFYAGAIHKRLQEARAAAEKETSVGTPGTALVLASRDVAVQNAVHEEYGKLRFTTRRTRINAAGAAAGRAAGERANLHNRPEAAAGFRRGLPA